MFFDHISTLCDLLPTASVPHRQYILSYLDTLHRADYAGLPLHQFELSLTQEDTEYLEKDLQFQGNWLVILMGSPQPTHQRRTRKHRRAQRTIYVRNGHRIPRQNQSRPKQPWILAPLQITQPLDRSGAPSENAVSRFTI